MTTTNTDVYAVAARRLSDLSLPADLINDESGQTSGDEHATWLANATDAEITDWAAQMVIEDAE